MLQAEVRLPTRRRETPESAYRLGIHTLGRVCGQSDALRRVCRRSGPAVVVLAIALATVVAAVAQSRVVFIHGKAYGEMPAPRARELSSLSSPATRATPLIVGGTPQAPLTYGGGPLMLSSTLYLIFWGPEADFPSSYTGPIIQYAKDLQADESLTTDEFSVAEQYTNAKAEHITGKVTFGADMFDTTHYPALEATEGCATEPCVTDRQIQSEILSQIEAQGWPTNIPEAPAAQYLLFTPKGVTNCLEGECTTSGGAAFCAYHGQIAAPGSHVATYSDLPYVPECDSEQAPLGVGGNADADGTLDSEIHEIVESATDPEGTGYLDTNGEEAADKCTNPVVETQPEIYGTPLGGSLAEDTAFNQLIGGHSYYTQQIWSDAATKTPATTEAAGCAARIGPTPSFNAPASGQTGQPISFDASGSYDINESIATYEWNYGDGSPPDTTSGVSAKHTYLKPGTYQVSLTVSDSSGSADASTQTLPIEITGAAMEPPPTNPGSGSTGGGSSPTPETTASSSSTSASSSNPGTTSTTGQASAKPATLTKAQKLARAIKACQKLKKGKRASCIAAAKKRFAPAKGKHKRTKPKAKRR
jgi:hypothetical protein